MEKQDGKYMYNFPREGFGRKIEELLVIDLLILYEICFFRLLSF